MALELRKCILCYVTRLEELDNKWKDLLKKAERLLDAMVTQAEQYQLVRKKLEDTVDITDKEMWERLLYRIRIKGIEEEFKSLSDIVMQFNHASRSLKFHLDNLEYARSKVSLEDKEIQELINGTPTEPKLDTFLQWAVEGFQFYHNMYLCINDCMKLVDFTSKETIDKLVSSFKEEKRARMNLDRILCFTTLLKMTKDDYVPKFTTTFAKIGARQHNKMYLDK